ncbi:hypothetical protein [Streptomyces phaeochromogenes]|uniref:hypothetical protein n=1 Tax=Streptomyces phaeochromogenes TaxID=1923 RepID=UPI0033C4A3B5
MATAQKVRGCRRCQPKAATASPAIRTATARASSTGRAAAAPDDTAVHTARAEVYALRAAQERSTMSTGIFTWAEAESRAVLAGTDAMTELTPATPTR